MGVGQHRLVRLGEGGEGQGVGGRAGGGEPHLGVGVQQGADEIAGPRAHGPVAIAGLGPAGEPAEHLEHLGHGPGDIVGGEVVAGHRVFSDPACRGGQPARGARSPPTDRPRQGGDQAARILARAQHAREMQHQRPVQRRPEEVAGEIGVAGKRSGGDAVAQVQGHGRAGALGRADEIGIVPLVRLAGVEHQLVGLGVREGEIDIGGEQRVGAGVRVMRGLFVGALQRLGVTIEAARPGGGEHGVPVGEVAVGRHRADAQGLGDLADGHGLHAVVGEQPLGHIDQPLAEIGDVGWGKDLGQKCDPMPKTACVALALTP